MAKPKRICSVEGCGKPRHGVGFCVSHYKRWKKHGDPLKGGTFFGAPLRWIHEVALRWEEDACLEWPFAKNLDGRGVVYFDGKNIPAHRLIARFALGEPPEPNYHAAHSCGMGHSGCVNPRHLRWATCKENVNDTLAHGTRNRGERHGSSRLTEAIVREIRSMEGALSQEGIAKKFGISREHVRNIHQRRRWTWLY